MGIDMEIDLIMGLAKPKTALTALPTDGTPDIAEGDLPDFSALLSAENLDDSVAPEGAPTPELPLQIVALAPQEKVLELTQNPEPGPKLLAEVEAKAVPEKPLDSNALPSFITPSILLAQPQPQTEKPSPRLAEQTRPAEIFAVNSIAAPAQPDQAVKAVELAPISPISLGKRALPDPPQKPDIEVKSPAPTVADAPQAAKAQVAQVAQVAQILPLPLGNQANALPEPTPDEPKTNQPALSLQTPAKIVAQPLVLPAPAIGFTNVETITDDPAEIQFGIKIERQVVETILPSRAAVAAAPVATQITAQLPQLLTKADKQTIELRLDPPELGRVTIHLTTNDQQVTAQVIADRPDTVDLMRRHAELLAATLARAGFSQADLSFQQGQSQNNKGEFEQFQSIAGISESDEPAISTPILTGQDGRLDIRL